VFCIEKADFFDISILDKSDFMFVDGMICLGALFRLIIQIAFERLEVELSMSSAVLAFDL